MGFLPSFQYNAKKSVSISALVIILGNKSATNNLCSGYLHISTAINRGVCLSFCINLASRAILYTSRAGHKGINLLISSATLRPSIYATSSQRRLANTALLNNATLLCLAANAPDPPASLSVSNFEVGFTNGFNLEHISLKLIIYTSIYNHELDGLDILYHSSSVCNLSDS